jgi:hypothetical protein
MGFLSKFQTKDYKIGICCFSNKHPQQGVSAKINLLGNQNNVSGESVFSHYKNPTKRVDLLQSGHHHYTHQKVHRSHYDIAEKLFTLSL